jgi:hypothetical protein
MRGHRWDRPHQLYSPHRSEDFFKINALFLHILLCDESCLVLDDATMFIFLGIVDDPLEADRTISHNERMMTSHVVFPRWAVAPPPWPCASLDHLGLLQVMLAPQRSPHTAPPETRDLLALLPLPDPGHC